MLLNRRDIMTFNLPENMVLDRVASYGGQEYRIVEILNSGLLLVVKKDEFDKGVYPMQTYVIPGQ